MAHTLNSKYVGHGWSMLFFKTVVYHTQLTYPKIKDLYMKQMHKQKTNP